MALAGVLALLPSMPAWSLPAFAREMGVPCSVCHTHAFGPALTAFGRNFKLHGYAMGTRSTIPLSADAIASYTHTVENQPQPRSFSGNDNFAFDNINGYFAGRIADHLGAFIQGTYDGIARHASWGIFDARYARDLPWGNTLLGVTVNNYPTVQDPWNSTYAWQFPIPYARLNNVPNGAPQLYGFYATQVLGASVYSMVHDIAYLELGGYRRLSDRLQEDFGITNPQFEHNLNGTAPYWRAALQKSMGSHYGSVGILGFQPTAQSYSERPVAANDNYTDVAFDATYQFSNGGPHTFNANASYVLEQQRLHGLTALGASSAVDNHLHTFTINGQYAYKQTYSVTLAYFDISGNSNPASYSAAPWYGSANHSPDSTYYIVQLESIPFGKIASFAQPYLNMRFGLQYQIYTRFNGGSSNYDGYGHSAHDNDTLFLYLWMAI
jgi:hypothetical protein